MLFELLMLLCPLFIGFMIRCQSEKWLKLINHLLMLIVYFILFIMGAELAHLENLFEHLPSLIQATFVLFLCSVGFNFICLIGLEKIRPWRELKPNLKKESSLNLFLESSKVILVLLIGFFIGYFFESLPIWQYHKIISKSTLILLLFLVGIQLRTSNMSLKQILFNKIGVLTTSIVILSCALGGMIFAFIYDLPWNQGLVMASGYGFYSLSGILVKQEYGALYGNMTLLNDILREVMSMIFIPIIMRRFKYAALGIAGATSMDFTLPMLTKSGSVVVVAPAIVQGFLLSLLMPILVLFFSFI